MKIYKSNSQFLRIFFVHTYFPINININGNLENQNSAEIKSISGTSIFLLLIKCFECFEMKSKYIEVGLQHQPVYRKKNLLAISMG